MGDPKAQFVPNNTTPAPQTTPNETKPEAAPSQPVTTPSADAAKADVGELADLLPVELISLDYPGSVPKNLQSLGPLLDNPTSDNKTQLENFASQFAIIQVLLGEEGKSSDSVNAFAQKIETALNSIKDEPTPTRTNSSTSAPPAQANSPNSSIEGGINQLHEGAKSISDDISSLTDANNSDTLNARIASLKDAVMDMLGNLETLEENAAADKTEDLLKMFTRLENLGGSLENAVTQQKSKAAMAQLLQDNGIQTGGSVQQDVNTTDDNNKSVTLYTFSGVVFRSDSRDAATIASSGGFSGRQDLSDPNNLKEAQGILTNKGLGATGQSGVSTASSMDGAFNYGEFAEGRNRMYVIDTTKLGNEKAYDMSANVTNNYSDRTDETGGEVNITHVPNSAILGYIEYSTEGEFIPPTFHSLNNR